MPINFAAELNPAQLEAVTTTEGPLLVIAGAGSGKTRTLVYRLANLVSRGVPAENILLLTFTRKAAGEMLTRAGRLLGMSLPKSSGGTFHSFAYGVIRRHAPLLGYPEAVTVMDRSDAEDVLAETRRELGIAPKDKTFPRRGAVLELLSKARNKEEDLAETLSREALHLLPFLGDFARLAEGYAAFKAERGLLDYDDLLFALETLFRDHPGALDQVRGRYRYVMVDEYQDTNLVQARLVRHLGGGFGNVMAVGDDAQSIYAFRGASVDNILRFPEEFPGTRVVTLEQNYRSTQPILDVTNSILAQSSRRFEKNLRAFRDGGEAPRLILPHSDFSQADLVLGLVRELLGRYEPHRVAVLFRAGYQSYALEMALNKARIPFQKYGGIKFSEAAHIRDVLAYLRLVQNPLDLPALTRCLEHVPGVGQRTAVKVNQALARADAALLAKQTKRHPGLAELLGFIEDLRLGPTAPAPLLDRVATFYAPLLARAHPEDYPRRQLGIEQLSQIAAGYATLDAFLAELTLENPEAGEEAGKEHLVLSTVHSAKGLEWDAVAVIDLVDDRFPSRHALAGSQDMEEERRLLYVALTRARNELYLFAPKRVLQRQTGMSIPARVSLFLRELPGELLPRREEAYPGAGLYPVNGFSPGRAEVLPRPAFSPPSPQDPEEAAAPSPPPARLGPCRHKIFGTGKVIADLGGGKLRVNFQGFGLKVIMADYLTMLGGTESS